MDFKTVNIYTEETRYFLNEKQMQEYLEEQTKTIWELEDFCVYYFKAETWEWLER